MKEKLIGGIVVIIVLGIIIVSTITNKDLLVPIEAYQVSLDGVKIGVINSRNDLYELIDTEQTELKTKYKVNKVYPPNGLSVQKIYTYDNEIVEEKSIYDSIKDEQPFTIEGYVVTINYSDSVLSNNEDDDYTTNKKKEPVKLYVLDKSIVKEALYNTAAAFIGSKDLKNFENDTQSEIIDTGEVITSVYFDETITIKKDYISTNEHIFMNVQDLSSYLLYGSLQNYKTYIVKDGENLEKIADNYYLSIEELLIANPQVDSGNVLLAAGDKINVAEINPLVHVIYKKTVVEDVTINYKTTYVNDSSKYTSYKQTTTAGKNGKTRVTQDVKYVNGEIASLTSLKKEVLVEAVNEVITRGTKTSSGGHYTYETYKGNSKWSWPTISPYRICSRFKMRTLFNQTKMHQGIDIILVGNKSLGSPIYAVKEGKVVHVNWNTSKNEGRAIWIEHEGGIYTQYMHMTEMYVKVGDYVKREQKIGTMGRTGRVTGPHLHLGVWYGYPYREGVAKDPCKTIFKC